MTTMRENLTQPLEALSRISQEINTLQEIDPLLKSILRIAMEVIGAERGFILMLDERQQLALRIAQNLSEAQASDLSQVSQSVLQQVMETGEPIICFDALADDRFQGAQSIQIQRIQSIAAVPLTIKTRPIGAIYLDSIQRRAGFKPESLPFITAFAHQAAIAIENAQLYAALREENRLLKKQIQQSHSFKEIIGRSSAMKQVFELMESVIDSDVTVLISGESGTGKELVARAIHYNGPRKDKPFIALFCGALPENLLESELFGHKKGAFTGATSDKKGLFEAADGGSFFLDEIGDLSPKIQTELLRVIQEGEIKRVGENQVRYVNVRIIAATNKNLEELVQAGLFREDLYYRLNVIKIELPPLRKREGDIPLLANYFLTKHAAKTRKQVQGISPEAMKRLTSYHWPGNVRELENTIERALLLTKDIFIQPENLQLPEPEIKLPERMSLKDFERQIVQKTLAENDNNISRTAEQLGVSRRWLHYRIKEWEHEEDQ
ncbi:MAG: sigma 54-interacting transcriptional regulator [candidate division KSB1 bacterium]|nr:sigma 54-interacting transcriptional regulator [candidate division KSB1 bacterium]MDZ7334386.1 sigma 54-interacting transcriptional regulator [candidate division KSB1 bacterium]MDZ7358264.1 sigma 54-interacting transcriptional regulator [candidate division KSB1 bacterium]MDZ7375267.1 sigma 54-interacting transcriptional regulator [candidate division KSB1 bacterium]MDZ7398807.1 sigma 54-interacting transcriptional regulator [candidate division KSB1 bacterium]